MKTPLIGICRHRLTTDGQGVTTLVAFHGCPLCCRYCLNEQCLRADGVWQQMDAQQILDEVMIDDHMNPDIYRRYTSADNCKVIDNLRWLITHVDAQKITIRLPHIPDYNTLTDIAQSRSQLESMGFTIFDSFEYVIR